MIDRNRLVWASVFFGVAWAIGMIWWMGISLASVIIWSIGGAIAGVLWYFAMKWWMTRHGSSNQ
jgi:hypothetical protein